MVRDDDGDGLGDGDGSDGADDALMVTRRVTRTRTGELKRGGSMMMMVMIMVMVLMMPVW